MNVPTGGADTRDDRGIVVGDRVAFMEQSLGEAAAGDRVLLLGDHGKSEQRTGGGRLGEVIVGGVRVERLGFPRRGDRLFDDFGDRIDALIFRGDAADESLQVVDRGELLGAEGGERLGGGQGPGLSEVGRCGWTGCIGGHGVTSM